MIRSRDATRYSAASRIDDSSRSMFARASARKALGVGDFGANLLYLAKSGFLFVSGLRFFSLAILPLLGDELAGFLARRRLDPLSPRYDFTANSSVEDFLEPRGLDEVGEQRFILG